MTWPTVVAEVPEWGEVRVKAPSLAQIDSARQTGGEEVEDAETKVTDQNIRILSLVITPPRSETELREELSYRSLALLLAALLEVSGVTSGERFRPADDDG